jgi:hypothetical protein
MFWNHPNIAQPSNALVLQRRPNAFSLSEMSRRRCPRPQRILPTDPSEAIVRRTRSAVTDSISGITFDSVGRLGMSTLITNFSAFTGEAPAVLAERYARSNHGALKEDVAEAVEEALRKARAECGVCASSWGEDVPGVGRAGWSRKGLRTLLWDDEGSSKVRRTKLGVITLTHSWGHSRLTWVVTPVGGISKP